MANQQSDSESTPIPIEESPLPERGEQRVGSQESRPGLEQRRQLVNALRREQHDIALVRDELGRFFTEPTEIVDTGSEASLPEIQQQIEASASGFLELNRQLLAQMDGKRFSDHDIPVEELQNLLETARSVKRGSESIAHLNQKARAALQAELARTRTERGFQSDQDLASRIDGLQEELRQIEQRIKKRRQSVPVPIIGKSIAQLMYRKQFKEEFHAIAAIAEERDELHQLQVQLEHAQAAEFLPGELIGALNAMESNSAMAVHVVLRGLRNDLYSQNRMLKNLEELEQVPEARRLSEAEVATLFHEYWEHIIMPRLIESTQRESWRKEKPNLDDPESRARAEELFRSTVLDQADQKVGRPMQANMSEVDTVAEALGVDSRTLQDHLNWVFREQPAKQLETFMALAEASGLDELSTQASALKESIVAKLKMHIPDIETHPQYSLPAVVNLKSADPAAQEWQDSWLKVFLESPLVHARLGEERMEDVRRHFALTLRDQIISGKRRGLEAGRPAQCLLLFTDPDIVPYTVLNAFRIDDGSGTRQLISHHQKSENTELARFAATFEPDKLEAVRQAGWPNIAAMLELIREHPTIFYTRRFYSETKGVPSEDNPVFEQIQKHAERGAAQMLLSNDPLVQQFGVQVLQQLESNFDPETVQAILSGWANASFQSKLRPRFREAVWRQVERSYSNPGISLELVRQYHAQPSFIQEEIRYFAPTMALASLEKGGEMTEAEQEQLAQILSISLTELRNTLVLAEHNKLWRSGTFTPSEWTNHVRAAQVPGLIPFLKRGQEEFDLAYAPAVAQYYGELVTHQDSLFHVLAAYKSIRPEGKIPWDAPLAATLGQIVSDPQKTEQFLAMLTDKQIPPDIHDFFMSEAFLGTCQHLPRAFEYLVYMSREATALFREEHREFREKLFLPRPDTTTLEVFSDIRNLQLIDYFLSTYSKAGHDLVRQYVQELKAGKLGPDDSECVREFTQHLRSVDGELIAAFRQAKEQRTEQMFLARLQTMAESMTGQRPLTAREREASIYPGMIRAIYAKNAGNFGTYESIAHCQDRLEDLQDLTIRPVYQIDLAAVGQISLREGLALDDKHLHELRAPLEAFVAEYGSDQVGRQRAKEALMATLQSILAECSPTLNEALKEEPVEHQLLALVLLERFGSPQEQAALETHNLKDLLMQYAFSETVIAGDYLRQSSKRITGASNEAYAELAELHNLYADQVKEAMRKLMESAWTHPAIAVHHKRLFENIQQAQQQRERSDVANRLQIVKLGWSEGFQRQLRRSLEAQTGRQYTDEQLTRLVRLYEGITVGLQNEKTTSAKPRTKRFYGQLRSQRERTFAAIREITGKTLEPQELFLSELSLEEILQTQVSIVNGSYDEEQFTSYVAENLNGYFSKEVELAEQELKKFTSSTGQGRSILKGHITKTKETAHARMVAGVCVANDNPIPNHSVRNMWEMPNYFDLVLRDPETDRCQGAVLLHRFTDEQGRKILTASINPSSTYLYTVDETSLFEGIMDTLELFAQDNEFDLITVSKNKTIRTNRTGGTFEKALDARIQHMNESYVFDQPVQFSYKNSYNMQQMDVVWKRPSAT